MYTVGHEVICELLHLALEGCSVPLGRSTSDSELTCWLSVLSEFPRSVAPSLFANVTLLGVCAALTAWFLYPCTDLVGKAKWW